MNNSVQRPTGGSDKNRLIDLALVIVIVLSVAFVAYRLFSPKTNTRVVTPTSAPLPPAASIQGSKRAAGAGGGWFSWLSTFHHIADADWKTLLNDPGVAAHVSKSTKSCDDQNSPKLWSLFIEDPNAVEKLTKNEFRIAFDPADRLCVRLQDAVNVVYTETQDTRAYLTFVGRVDVESILNLNSHQWPTSLLSALGLTQEDINQNLKLPAGIKKSVSPLFRWSKLRPGQPDALPPRPTTLIPMTRMRFEATAPAKYLVVDLRPPEVAEKEVSTLKKNSRLEMISIPFLLPPGVSSTFSYSVTVAQLKRSVFEVEKILLTDKSKFAGVVLVGSGPTDGRPLWAERSLQRLGLKLFDFPEGAQHLGTLTP